MRYLTVVALCQGVRWVRMTTLIKVPKEPNTLSSNPQILIAKSVTISAERRDHFKMMMMMLSSVPVIFCRNLSKSGLQISTLKTATELTKFHKVKPASLGLDLHFKMWQGNTHLMPRTWDMPSNFILGNTLFWGRDGGKKQLTHKEPTPCFMHIFYHFLSTPLTVLFSWKKLVELNNTT